MLPAAVMMSLMLVMKMMVLAKDEERTVEVFGSSELPVAFGAFSGG